MRFKNKPGPDPKMRRQTDLYKTTPARHGRQIDGHLSDYFTEAHN